MAKGKTKKGKTSISARQSGTTSGTAVRRVRAGEVTETSDFSGDDFGGSGIVSGTVKRDEKAAEKKAKKAEKSVGKKDKAKKTKKAEKRVADKKDDIKHGKDADASIASKAKSEDTKFSDAITAKTDDSDKRKKKSEKKGLAILRPFKAIGRYFVGSWRELRQVRWPDRPATWKMTAAVLLFSAFFALLVLTCDWLFDLLMKNVIL